MKKLIWVAMLLAGCGQNPDPRDAKIKELEKRLAAVENAPVASQPPPAVTPPVRAEAEPVKKESAITPPVVNIQGRMVEANDIWCKWATITTIANTNEQEARYRLYIQFLDKDGFPIDESDVPAVTPAMTTNKVTDMRLINAPAGRNVKSFKAYTYHSQF